MADEPKDLMEEVEEDFELLDTVEYEGELYFMLIPATDNDEIDGEVFIMRRVEAENGEEMLEAVEDEATFDAVYNIFKEKNKDEFEFLD
ncbi:MAG: DUF1292 domain-containing protein [Oscillospiraceae bacterium]|nr:DUF1292 domain-containing protein [Oscillospiraceae bacterium]